MSKFLFTLFATGSAFGIGAAAFGVYAHVRLWMLSNTGRRNGRRRHGYAIAAKLGYILTSATLLSVVVPRADVQPRWQAWMYVAGLFLAGVGFSGQTRAATDELVDKEEVKDR